MHSTLPTTIHIDFFAVMINWYRPQICNQEKNETILSVNTIQASFLIILFHFLLFLGEVGRENVHSKRCHAPSMTNIKPNAIRAFIPYSMRFIENKK